MLPSELRLSLDGVQVADRAGKGWFLPGPEARILKLDMNLAAMGSWHRQRSGESAKLSGAEGSPRCRACRV